MTKHKHDDDDPPEHPEQKHEPRHQPKHEPAAPHELAPVTQPNPMGIPDAPAKDDAA